MASQTQTINKLSETTKTLSLRGSTVPIKSSGKLLSQYKHFDNTTVIGTQFDDLQLADILDNDDLIRDLAILVSERNVAFFKNQSLTVPQQKILGEKLGKLSGKPAASTLHIHPITEEASELGDEISVISSDRRPAYEAKSHFASNGWHSDITFEPVPSDFAILKIHTLPETGGDTLWASACAAYDKLSPQYQTFLEGLTAVHDANFFHLVAQKLGNKSRTEQRGNPENVGDNYSTTHPVIRTNPVTGWKGLFVNPAFTKRIVELNVDESKHTLDYLFDIVAKNHDIQVRFKWDKNDVAIWSNTSSFHTATWDYSDRRVGDRVVSIGERPYFDPKSRSRAESLGLKK